MDPRNNIWKPGALPFVNGCSGFSLSGKGWIISKNQIATQGQKEAATIFCFPSCSSVDSCLLFDLVDNSRAGFEPEIMKFAKLRGSSSINESAWLQTPFWVGVWNRMGGTQSHLGMA